MCKALSYGDILFLICNCHTELEWKGYELLAINTFSKLVNSRKKKSSLNQIHSAFSSSYTNEKLHRATALDDNDLRPKYSDHKDFFSSQ